MIDQAERDGWYQYEDEVGWSIWLPPGSEVSSTSIGIAIILEGIGVIGVGVAADATPDDTGSFDYLEANLEFAETDGLIKPLPDDPDYFYLDVNQNDLEDLMDIWLVETRLAVDGEGNALPDDVISPVWWYGYYDPDARPAFGYIFQTFGTDPLLFVLADQIILTFEPAFGYPAG